ncbi:serine/threonine-protein kinase [Acrasis kona]|uniref:non-specific serine/threonine protein kinase n=1 Tax=Acrasis kona TaxID=1008807 RepID=A0AAW2YUU8_9EUKA
MPSPVDGASRVNMNGDDITVYVHKKLGKGGQGSVYFCTNQKTSQQCAMKFIEVDSEEDLQMAKREFELLSVLVHPHIVRIIEVYENRSECFSLYFTMPMYKHGDLSSVMKKHTKNNQYFHPKFVLSACCQLSDAIAYIHEKTIVHRDVKPENVLIKRLNSDSTMEFSLCDFGLSKEIACSSRHSRVGSFYYMSPEVYKESNYGFKVDVFSLGVIMYQIMSLNMKRNIAWDLHGGSEARIAEELRSDMQKSSNPYDQDLIDLVIEMLRANSQDRPSAKFIYDFCIKKIIEMRKHQREGSDSPSKSFDEFSESPVSPISMSHLFDKDSNTPPSPEKITKRSAPIPPRILVPNCEDFGNSEFLHRSRNNSLPAMRGSPLINELLTFGNRTRSSSQMSPKKTTSPIIPEGAILPELVTFKVVHKSITNSIKNLVLHQKKGVPLEFFSIEEALNVASTRVPATSHVQIRLTDGTFTLKKPIKIERGNITLQGYSVNQKTIIRGRELIVNDQNNVFIKDIIFRGPRIKKSGNTPNSPSPSSSPSSPEGPGTIHIVSKAAVDRIPFQIVLVDSDTTIENCVINGRLFLSGDETHDPQIDHCQIFGNKSLDADGPELSIDHALVVSGCRAQITNCRIFEHFTNGILITGGASGILSNNYIYNINSKKVGSWALNINDKSNPILRENFIFDNYFAIVVEESNPVLIGNDVHTNTKGLSVNHAECLSELNKFHKNEESINVTNNSQCVMLNNYVHGNVVGVAIEKSQGKFMKNHFDNNTNHALLLDESNIEFYNNVVSRGGIKAMNNTTGILEDNDISDNESCAVLVENSCITIKENRIHDNRKSGLEITKMCSPVIQGNHFYRHNKNDQGCAIWIEAMSSPTLMENQFDFNSNDIIEQTNIV